MAKERETHQIWNKKKIFYCKLLLSGLCEKKKYRLCLYSPTKHPSSLVQWSVWSEIPSGVGVVLKFLKFENMS